MDNPLELGFHLNNVEQVLRNLKELEKGGATSSIYDLKRVIEAVLYLLETHTIIKEDS